jgi:hypothetical protein
VQRRSYLSIVVVGNIQFDLSNGPAFYVVMTIWVGSGAAVWHPRTEELLAPVRLPTALIVGIGEAADLELDADAASYGGAGGTRTHDPGIMRATATTTLADFRLHLCWIRPTLGAFSPTVRRSFMA